MSINIDPSIVSFFMVGCPRCGTTWVDKALRDHPEIHLPPQKQTYFFDAFYDKGLEWYLENFSGARPGHLAVGEIATGYSLPHAMPLLAEHFPHVKIMLAMRNPVERAYSFFQSRAVAAGWSNIHDAISECPEILEQGKYIEHVERLKSYYADDRILLLFYDDLQQDDRAYLQRILNFLEVDNSFESPALGQMVQVAAFPRLRRTLRKLRLGILVDIISESAIGDIIRRQLKVRGVERYKPMERETMTYLTDYFRPYNLRLQENTGRDLSSWMTVDP